MIAAFLGVIQGLTEFLPISSSAHLRIFGEFLLPEKDPGAFFTAIIQIGTELAVLVYFWRDISRIIISWFQAVFGKRSHTNPDVRLGWLIIIGSLPIGVFGLLFQSYIETVLRNLWVTASMLIVFGILLGLADKYGKNKRELSQLRWGQGLVFGFAQALALIPGVSRSGGTILAGRLMGFTRPEAARYSFLLAIPAVLASGLFGVVKSVGEPMVLGWGPTILATMVSFVVGFAVIIGFLKYISTRSFAVFVWYRVILGALIFVLLGTGVLHAV